MASLYACGQCTFTSWVNALLDSENKEGIHSQQLAETLACIETSGFLLVVHSGRVGHTLLLRGRGGGSGNEIRPYRQMLLFACDEKPSHTGRRSRERAGQHFS